MSLTVQEITQAMGSECFELTGIINVEFDSREITGGSLFVPFAGMRDGHESIQRAITNGAFASLWSPPVEQIPKDFPVIPVADPLKAIQQLTTYYLEKVGVEVVTTTGDSGETTMKDLVASILPERYKTYKTQGNCNNNTGPSYTILHMPQDTEKVVLGMGVDHANKITEPSLMAQPKAAVITMIGKAYIGNLGPREGIAKAKAEITDGLVLDRLFVMPTDEPLLTPLTATLVQTVTTFGIGNGDVHAEVTAEGKAQTNFVVEGETFTIPLPGSYSAMNALTAYTIERFFGLSIPEIRQGLTHISIVQNRTERPMAGNGVAILSDVYNTNPTAMRLVLNTFKSLPTKGRRIAVSADMLELEKDSLNMRVQTSGHIDPEEFATIFLYREQMHALKEDLNQKYPQLPVFYSEKEKNKLIETAKRNLELIDGIMLKGNNSMGLLETVEQFRQMK